MITEDYVSFETAKLLKEKGFDSEDVGCKGGFYSERCYESGNGIVTESGQEVGLVYDDLTNCELDYDEYLRPTLQMAMKWLREVHNVVISVYPFLKEWKSLEIKYYTCNIATRSLSSQDGHIRGIWNSYEESCEAAIKYCLENLI